jgi:hypothetical protein
LFLSTRDSPLPTIMPEMVRRLGGRISILVDTETGPTPKRGGSAWPLRFRTRLPAISSVHRHLARMLFVASKCVPRMNSYLMNFERRLVLATAIAGVVAVTSPGATPRPNVVFNAIDDLNDWVGCLGGNPDVKTQNIDRLAGRGMLFTNAHCQVLVCMASRVSVMSGKLASTTMATEFVGTSISSGGDGSQLPRSGQHFLAENPFVKSFNAEREYVRCEVTPKSWRTDYRTVEYVTRPGAPVNTRRSFVVESGRAQLQSA